jgi:hypothetical protein
MTGASQTRVSIDGPSGVQVGRLVTVDGGRAAGPYVFAGPRQLGAF